MAIIAYNEAIDEEVMEVLTHCVLKNYTKIIGVYGKGNTSGTHLGNDIWPGRNNMIYAAGGEKEIKQLISCVKELRSRLGNEGIKAFILPIEEVT